VFDWTTLLPSVVGPLTAAVLAFGVGNRLSARWALRQKRREMTISATYEFHRLYGDFFATWKLWYYTLGASPERHHDYRWELMKKAATSEAGVESLFVRLATERRLLDHEIEALGKFRQAYQKLRQAIRDGRNLPWSSSDHPEYVAFKRLAAATAHLLESSDSAPKPTQGETQAALLRITSNEWESQWLIPAPEASVVTTASSWPRRWRRA
jgi:hypothetical protein